MNNLSELDREGVLQFFTEKLREVYQGSHQAVVDKYGLIIVGGQALSLWAKEYLLDEMTGEEIHFSFSDDLDFIGNAKAPDFCEERMRISFKRASIDSHTPNIAAAEVPWRDGARLVIDILDAVAGVSTRDIYKNLESVYIGGARVAILDPISCLQSRLFNLYAPWCSDQRRESVRVNLAVKASRCFLQDVLCDDGFSAIRPHLKRLRDLALSGLGKDLFYDFGVNILDAVPRDRYLMPPAFFEKEWPRFNTEIDDARKRKAVQYERYGRQPIGQKFSVDSMRADPALDVHF